MLHILTNAPRTIAAGEKQYLVGALKLRELGLLQRWIAEHSERPSDALRRTIDLIPESERAQAEAQARAADEYWPPAPGTTRGNTILFRDLDGQMAFLSTFFGKFQAVTPDELETIAGGLSEEDFGVLVAVAFGDDDLDPQQARAAARARLEGLAALQDEAARALEASLSATLGESSSPISGASTDSSPTPSAS